MIESKMIRPLGGIYGSSSPPTMDDLPTNSFNDRDGSIDRKDGARSMNRLGGIFGVSGRFRTAPTEATDGQAASLRSAASQKASGNALPVPIGGGFSGNSGSVERGPAPVGGGMSANSGMDFGSSLIGSAWGSINVNFDEPGDAMKDNGQNGVHSRVLDMLMPLRAGTTADGVGVVNGGSNRSGDFEKESKVFRLMVGLVENRGFNVVALRKILRRGMNPSRRNFSAEGDEAEYRLFEWHRELSMLHLLLLAVVVLVLVVFGVFWSALPPELTHAPLTPVQRFFGLAPDLHYPCDRDVLSWWTWWQLYVLVPLVVLLVFALALGRMTRGVAAFTGFVRRARFVRHFYESDFFIWAFLIPFFTTNVLSAVVVFVVPAACRLHALQVLVTLTAMTTPTIWCFTATNLNARVTFVIVSMLLVAGASGWHYAGTFS